MADQQVKVPDEFLAGMHLITIEGIERFRDMFADGLTSKNGKFMVGIGINTNGAQNGILLPTLPEWSQKTGRPVQYKYQRGYNRVVNRRLARTRRRALERLEAGEEMVPVMKAVATSVWQLQCGVRTLLSAPYRGAVLPAWKGKPLPLSSAFAGSTEEVARIWDEALREILEDTAQDSRAKEQVPQELNRKLELAAETVRRTASQQFLHGPVGKLPVGTIPVPVVRWLVPVPDEWSESFRKHRAVAAEMDDWSGAQEELLGQLQRKVYEMFPEYADEICDTYAFSTCCRLAEEASQRSAETFPVEEREAIMEAFLVVYLAALVGHHPSGLSEMVQKALDAGGMPYGWVGRPPQGRLIVYWPYDEAPTFED